MTNCGCKPGTKENGWHEVVCASCLRKEKALFAKAIRLTRTKILKEMRNKK